MGVIAICDNLGPLDNFRSLPLLGEIKAGIARSRRHAFYLAYTEEVTILSQPVTELERGLVVIDLKAGTFKPEDAGKMSSGAF